MDIAGKLREQAEQYPHKPFIIFKDNTITFQEAVNTVNKLANFLAKQGIKKGDKVAIYLPNGPEYVYSYFAVFTLGAVAVPLDIRLTPEELTGVLKHSEAAFILSQSGLAAQASRPMENLPCPALFAPFDAALREESPRIAAIKVKEKDPAILFYTSGTTGAPKAVILNYRHLDNAPLMFEHIKITDMFATIICPLPLAHIGGFISLQINASFGSTLVLMDRFMPVEFLRLVEKYKVTFFFIVPPMFIAMLHLKEFEKYNLASLRGADVFGAPSDPAMIMRFKQCCPNAVLFNGWGMTETSAPNTVSAPDKLDSVGRAAPWCEIKIFDHCDKELPAGEIGEIVVRGWPVMAGYYKEPRMTKEILRRGWLHTGDLGCLDKEGNLYIKGRKKDMIIVGGLNVYSPEVEHTIAAHPQVKEVAVIGIPDKLRGEAVKAVVVLKEGERAGEQDIKTFCKERLIHFKVPQVVEFRETLPKTASGKVRKEALKEAQVQSAM
ncbi:MAG: AMP-binding protein [Candidatus Omnitrophota bacterium]